MYGKKVRIRIHAGPPGPHETKPIEVTGTIEPNQDRSLDSAWVLVEFNDDHGSWRERFLIERANFLPEAER